MSEGYKFSGEAGLSQSFTLTEKEAHTIERLGMTQDGLHKLLNGRPFAEGSYALLFELPNNDPQLVAKAWKNPERDAQRSNNEYLALRLLRMRNFENSPRVDGHLKSSAVLFEEKIEGEPVKNFNEEVIEKLATALVSLHSVELNAYGNPLAERKKGSRMDLLLDGIATLHNIGLSFTDQPEIITTINDVLDRIKKEAHENSDAYANTNFTLIHFDLNPNNILLSKKDGAIVIVDWEQASAGDGAMDIAKLFLKSKLDVDQQREFLEKYQGLTIKKDPYLEKRIELYKPFVLINSIFWRLSVLRDKPQETPSVNEEQFYDRVKANLDKEINDLKSFL